MRVAVQHQVSLVCRLPRFERVVTRDGAHAFFAQGYEIRYRLPRKLQDGGVLLIVIALEEVLAPVELREDELDVIAALRLECKVAEKVDRVLWRYGSIPSCDQRSVHGQHVAIRPRCCAVAQNARMIEVRIRPDVNHRFPQNLGRSHFG